MPTPFPNGLTSWGVPVLPGLPMPFMGTYFFVNPANGSDNHDGKSPDRALSTLYKAHSLMTAGKNDVCFLIGDGATTATARLSLANAVAVNSAATTGTLVWSKNACHLIGITAPGAHWQRARIAPPTGTYTQATFASGNFIEITGNGCYFSNFSIFHGFSTGGADQQAIYLNGGQRNVFHNVHIGGMGDQASADDAGSCCVRFAASAENTFYHCAIGVDTVTRGAANGSLLFSGASSRNVFEDCLFSIHADAATPLIAKMSGASPLDRQTYFKRCIFANSVGSASTTLAAAATLAASAGGILVFQDCLRIGITDWGTDADSLAQIYVGGWSGGSTNHAGDDIGRGIVSVAS